MVELQVGDEVVWSDSVGEEFAGTVAGIYRGVLLMDRNYVILELTPTAETDDGFTTVAVLRSSIRK